MISYSSSIATMCLSSINSEIKPSNVRKSNTQSAATTRRVFSSLLAVSFELVERVLRVAAAALSYRNALEIRHQKTDS